MESNKPSGPGLDDTDPAVADTHASDPGASASPDGAATAKGPRQVRTGDTLGRYELGEELGEGGMATVFKARDKELRRDVAVKVLFPHLAKRAEVVRRFHREARAAAGLEHPNILRIYDVGGGENDDPPFIVMELIRGRTLLEEIEQRGFLLAEICACVGALLADALAAAHAAGIVHRDIKPSNVLIAPGGRLLLADFGVARLETEDSLVTRTGALLVTPAYMSPEQASGDTATAKSDLYSLGATLYQLSTSLLPYSGSPAKVMSLIATGQLVAPVKRRAEVGPDLSRAIEIMMHADPAQRPASAAAIAAELRQLATNGGLGDPKEELAAYFEDPRAFLDDRTPRVVTAIVAAGKQALAESRLPRALALADRASALAPDDPAVKTLVETVTEGGRASRRKKLALAAVGVVVLGGGGAFAVSRLAGPGAPAIDAQLAAVDAPIDQAIDAAPSDAVTPLEAIVPIDVAIQIDAPQRDAGPKRDATVAVAPLDAMTVPPVIDAAPLPIDAPPATAEDGTLVISNDTWCEVSIDDVPKGRLLVGRRITAKVPAGPHKVVCEQPGINRWERAANVEAGKIVPVAGTLLATVEVTISIAADRVQIDGTYYARGTVAKLKPGRHRGVVFKGDEGGAGGFFDIPRVPCRLHENGTGVVCDP